MAQAPLTAPPNRLLGALSKPVWEEVRPHCDNVALKLGHLLQEGGEPIERIYFPTSGVISSVAVFNGGRAAEMATTGPEGMVDIGAVLGAETALSRNLVQVTGSALVMEFDTFCRLRDEVPEFKTILLWYAQAFMAQVMQSVACNAVHSLEERAARWLLMCHDRTNREKFSLTQEFLAEMIGVSRPALNTVARALQRAGLIRYVRGAVTVEDREGLEASSCECYEIIRKHYDVRLFRALSNAGGDQAV